MLADLVPQGDLPGVPAGHARGEQPLHVAQEHHSVHPVVLAAGLLQERRRESVTDRSFNNYWLFMSKKGGIRGT